MKTIFDLMNENIEKLNKASNIFKKSYYDEVIELIDVNKAYLDEFKQRLKEIDTLPYYKLFARRGEQKKDINICLDGISSTKQDLKKLYKKLAEICEVEYKKL